METTAPARGTIAAPCCVLLKCLAMDDLAPIQAPAKSADANPSDRFADFRKEALAIQEILSKEDSPDMRSLEVRLDNWFNKVDLMLRGFLSYDPRQLDGLRQVAKQSLEITNPCSASYLLGPYELVRMRQALDHSIDMLEEIPAHLFPPSVPVGPHRY